MILKAILEQAIQEGASDIHLQTGHPPLLRLHGQLQPLNIESLSNEHLDSFLNELLSSSAYASLQDTKDIDCAYHLPTVGRFRMNAFQHHTGWAIALRIIPPHLPPLESFSNAPFLKALLQKSSGLILLTGATGSGKSTSLNSMIDFINRTEARHIITLEDPIEFVHPSQKSLIAQREIGQDALSFGRALKNILREDPDVILIGELRDLNSIRLALSAAETGHLVLSTLHTRSAAQAIERLIDVFPGDEKDLIRLQLAETLISVIQQVLVRNTEDKQSLAQEILVVTPAIRTLIRDYKLNQIAATMETQQAIGMQTMAQALERLVRDGLLAAQDVGKYLV